MVKDCFQTHLLLVFIDEGGAILNSCLFRRVIQGDLMADAPAEVLPFLSPNLNTEERMTLIQLQEMFRMIATIGDCLEKDPEFER